MNEETKTSAIIYVGHAGPVNSLPWESGQVQREDELIEREDWDGLIELRRQQAEECPCVDCEASVAEVLVTAERAEEALEVLTPIEPRRPGDHLVVELILESLLLLGRGVDDFGWTQKPRLFLLGEDALALCCRYLERAAGAVRVSKVRADVFADSYLDFDTEALAAAMARDDRFLIGEDGRGAPTVGLRSRSQQERVPVRGLPHQM